MRSADAASAFGLDDHQAPAQTLAKVYGESVVYPALRERTVELGQSDCLEVPSDCRGVVVESLGHPSAQNEPRLGESQASAEAAQRANLESARPNYQEIWEHLAFDLEVASD
jgi:hypothetical protein